MYPPFRFHKHECRPSGTSVLCAERPAAGGRNARREGVQRGDDIAVFRPTFTEKRKCHTASGRLPEGGKACHQGRERRQGMSSRTGKTGWHLLSRVTRTGNCTGHWQRKSEKSLPMMKRKLWPDRAKRAVLHGHADLNGHDNLRQGIIYQSISIRIYFCTVNPFPEGRRCFSFISHRKGGIRELLKMVITNFKTDIYDYHRKSGRAGRERETGGFASRP